MMVGRRLHQMAPSVAISVTFFTMVVMFPEIQASERRAVHLEDLQSATAHTSRSGILHRRIERLTSAITALRPTNVAWTLAVAISGFAILGALQRIYPTGPFGLWNLDAEGAPPTFFSATLLYAAAGLAALTVMRGRLDRWVLAVAGLWAFLGVDDANAIHERLQRATGIDWQYLYAPLALAGLVLFVALMRTTSGISRRLLLAGAAGWGISQVLELVQHGRVEPVALYNWYMVPEEVLEMAGSACFLMAMLLILHGGTEPEA